MVVSSTHRVKQEKAKKMSLSQAIGWVLAVGVGATIAFDVWLLAIARLGVPTFDFTLLGRWVGHALRGELTQGPIARAPSIQGERAVGWLLHYAIGVGFAALPLAWQGAAWAKRPTLWPAIIVGLCTVVAPLFVLQPLLGAGFASSRTAAPMKNVIRSVANHAVFGIGLYLAAQLVARFLR
jgi:hypothetical protein